jgi:hypothetical protein
MRGGLFIWWEGERPAATNFPERSSFSPTEFEDTRHLLSEGDWLSIGGEHTAGEPFARYEVTVPAPGRYELWARKFWKHGPFRWRFDERPWEVCPHSIALADNTDLMTHTCANWVFLGDVELAQGSHVFELRLLPQEGNSYTAAFDCFVLSAVPFMPNGRLKPGERWGLADEGYFPYEPGTDPFSDEALLDLRWLNESAAGESGFVRRDGSDLVLGSGEQVRFWGVNIGPNNLEQARHSLDYLARRLAKLGVNLVRIHGPIFDPSGDPAAVDEDRLDAIHYAVAAFKREGIYSVLSFYFPLWFEVQPHYGIPGYEETDNKLPFALIYFDDRMQEIHRSWARALLTTPNPHTGRPLAQEPAVALLELVNEDSFFFWTFNKENVPPVHWQRLERRFADWIGERYGAAEAAFAAWEGERLPEDDPERGRMGIYEVWHLTGDGLASGGPGKAARAADQARFLAEVQRVFYARATRHVKEELGAGCLVTASNWTTADPRTLDALERYTYTAGDVLDRHGYFQGAHGGEGAGYSVGVGHTFESLAAVSVPEQVPLQFLEVERYPKMISEIGWPSPNRFRADATLLTSAYGSLQGLDAVCFFVVNSNSLADGSVTKFGLGAPVIAGSFPAAALQFRRGDVAEAEPVVYEVVDTSDLLARRGPGAWAAPSLDDIREEEVPDESSTAVNVGRVDPLAFYVGRVVRAYGAEARQAEMGELARHIDRHRKLVTSATGELSWRYGDGLVLVDTSRSQAAAGFLSAAGRIDLTDVSFECDNEFASVAVVSLDAKPLATSRRFLIQAVTEDRPHGFRTEGDRIAHLGGRPFGMRKVNARVALRLDGEAPIRVIALDESGYASARPVDVRGGAGGGPVEIELAEDAMYHVVIRSQ